jgi:hypothetical protein
MRKTFGFCIIAGILIILGTAGSSDLGSLNMGDIVGRCCIGILITVFGYIGLKFSEVRK